MKYLLVITFALVVFWLWRHNRQVEKKAHQAPRAHSNAAEGKAITEMVACPVCNVHLPKSEALPGPDGFYCSEAHRREAGS